MVEQVFAHRTEVRSDGTHCDVGAVTAAAGLLRAWRPDGHVLADLEAFAKDLEGLRCAVVAAAARNRAEITRLTTPRPSPAPGGEDGEGGDGGGGPVPPAPPAGGAGEATGSDRDEACRQRRAARVAQLLPSAIAALDAGAITTGHVGALWFACEADPVRARRDETHLVAWARRFPVFRLRQLIRNWCRLGENPEDLAAEQDRKRGVYIDNTHPDAMIRVNATMRTADGKEFQAALDAIADEIYRSQHPERPRSAADLTTTLAQRRHDALAEMAHRANGTATTTGTKRRRPTITVIATLDHLRDGLGLAETPDGDALIAGDLRRLACDADIIPVVLGAESEVLDVGKSSRTPTPSQWNALVARDRGCSHPECSTPAEWCDAHHIVHWVDGGPTDLDNLTLLCRRHHTSLHNGEIAITGTAPNLEWHHPANGPPRKTGPPLPAT